MLKEWTKLILHNKSSLTLVHCLDGKLANTASIVIAALIHFLCLTLQQCICASYNKVSLRYAASLYHKVNGREAEMEGIASES